MSSPDLDRNVGTGQNVEIKPGTIESVFWHYCQQLGIPLEHLQDYIFYYLEATLIKTMGLVFPVSTMGGDREDIQRIHRSLVSVMEQSQTGLLALKKYNNHVPIPPSFDESGYAHPYLRLRSNTDIESKRLFTLRFIAETRMTLQGMKNKSKLKTHTA